MNDGKWHTQEIQTATIIERDRRLSGVRKFFHDIFPSLVMPPKKQKYIRTADGSEKRLGVIIPSAEGVRFYGTSVSLPGSEKDPADDNYDGWHDPLAVNLTPDAGDIPSDGWPDELKPEVVERILGYIPEDKS